jgi:diketogulonate reductase-like aldo/keto reductase
MPLLGFGCWKVPKETCAKTVQDALESGYRCVDSACDYGNEVEVGQGIAAAVAGGIDRKEIFVTSKLWNTYHEPQHVKAACQRTLTDLGLEYLDLYLIHFPIALQFVPFEERYPPEWFVDEKCTRHAFSNALLHETWAAMEALVEEGLVRNIGVANYNCVLIGQLMRYSKIKPAVLQVERHPYLTQPFLLDKCRIHGIQMTAYSSFGGSSYEVFGLNYETEGFGRLLDHKVVADVATSVNKTPAQVLLRWSIQSNVAVIPKSTNLSRIQQNADIFDFELSAEQMASLDSLNRDFHFNNVGKAFGTELAIFE